MIDEVANRKGGSEVTKKGLTKNLNTNEGSMEEMKECKKEAKERWKVEGRKQTKGKKRKEGR